MKILDVEQRSPEWMAARIGRLTASRAADMLATLKGGGEAAGRRNLRAQLVLERLTNKSQESGYVSAAMQQGIEREPDALLWYEALTGQILQRTGFLAHDELMAGASLDGHVGDFKGIVEAKCLIPATHLEYLKTGRVPDEYAKQITHQLWISGAQWCDWLTFNPDFPESLRSRCVRVQRGEVAIAEYERQVRVFLAEVDREMESLLTMADPRAVCATAAGVRDGTQH